jgi:pimeloyl-ACP methyl ester carboxylesterase
MDGVASTPFSVVADRPDKTAAVFVHGLFLNGAEFTLLRRRITATHGFAGHRFSYRTVGGSLPRAVEQLSEFVSRIDADRVHFVGHSLGGIILHSYFETARDLPPGRVVLLGSPTVRSKAAERVGRLPVLARLVRGVVSDELLNSRTREWRCDRELGCIAGTRPMGLGRLFARFDEDCDGTVGVSETKLPGHTAHMTLPVSHMGMLMSPLVAAQVGAFLENGRFSS